MFRNDVEPIGIRCWNRTLAAVLAVCCAGVILYCEPALAQQSFEGFASRLESIVDALQKVLRAIFVIAGLILSYVWVKGSQDARSKTERYLLGLILAASVEEIVAYFMGS